MQDPELPIIDDYNLHVWRSQQNNSILCQTPFLCQKFPSLHSLLACLNTRPAYLIIRSSASPFGPLFLRNRPFKRLCLRLTLPFPQRTIYEATPSQNRLFSHITTTFSSVRPDAGIQRGPFTHIYIFVYEKLPASATPVSVFDCAYRSSDNG